MRSHRLSTFHAPRVKHAHAPERRARSPRAATGSPLEAALLGGPARDGGSPARNPGRRPRSSRPRSAAPGRDRRAASDLPGAQPVRRPVDIGLAGDQIAGEVDEGAVGRVDADTADEHVGHGGGAGEAGVGRR